MNRAILNFEATIFSAGYTADTNDQYVVELSVNHHVIRRWTLTLQEGYLLSQDRGHLESWVAKKMFEAMEGRRG